MSRMVAARYRKQCLPFLQDQVGNAWTKKAQVDVVGINSMEKTLILGECKWSPRAMDRDVFEDLGQKMAEFVPLEGRWQVYDRGLACGSKTGEAQAYANTIAKLQMQGDSWQAFGMSLLDLAQVDQDLLA